MTAPAPALAAELAADLRLFFRPLHRAARNPAGLASWLGALGWDLRALAAAEVELVRSEAARADQALAAAVTGLAAGSAQEVAAAVQGALAQALGDLRGLAADWLRLALPELSAQQAASIGAALGADVFDSLCRQFLRRRFPLADRVAALLGLIALRKLEPIKLALAGKQVTLRRAVTHECTLLADLPKLAADPVGSLVEAREALAGLLGDADRAASRIAADVQGLQRALVSAGCPSLSATLEPTQLTVRGPLPAPAQGQLECRFTAGGIPLTLRLAGGTLALGWAAALPEGALGPRTLPGGLTLGPAPDDPPRVTLTCAATGAASLVAEAGVTVGLPLDLLTDGQGGQLSATAHARLAVDTAGAAKVALDPVTIRAQKIRLGGAAGLQLDLEHATVKGLAIPLDAGALSLDLQGSCELGGARIGARATLGADGFHLESSAEASLGGVHLVPCAAPCARARSGAAPVLSLQIARGHAASASVSVALAGDVVIPSHSGDVRLHLGGSAAAVLSPEGLSLTRVSASGTVAPLVLPGGIALDSLTGDLAWSRRTAGAAAPPLKLHLAGSASPRGGRVAFDGTLQLGADPGSSALDGTLTLEKLPLPGGGLLLSSSLALHAGSGECALTLDDGSAGLFPLVEGAARIDQFHLAVRELRGGLRLSAAGLKETAQLSGKLLLSRELATPVPDPLGGSVEVDFAAKLSGALQPLSLSLDELTATPGDLSIAKAGGLELRGCALGLSGLSLPPSARTPLRATLRGKADLPGGVGEATFDGSFSRSPAGELAFALESTDSFTLGGLKLLPQAAPASGPGAGRPKPTLRLKASTAGMAELEVAASLAIPRRPPGGSGPPTGTLDVSGSLKLHREPGGALRLDALAVSGSSPDPWPLAGPLSVAGLFASLQVTGDGAVQAALGGELRRSDGGSARLDATLRTQGLGGNDLVVAGTLDAGGFDVGGGLRLVQADLGLEIHTQPPSCTLTVAKGCLGALPRGAGKKPEEFDLRFEELAATVRLDQARASAALSGAIVLPAEAFAGADGKPARLALQGVPASDGAPAGQAQLEVRFSPFSLQLKQACASLQDVRLGGAGGVLVKSGRLALAGFSWPPAADAGWSASAAVSLQLPAGTLAAAGVLTARSFSLRAIEALDLAGVQILPLPVPAGAPPKPTLELDLNLGGPGGSAGGALHFALAGQVAIPVKDGKKLVEASGSIDASCDAAGKVTVAALHAMLHLEDAWELPGGLVVSNPTGSIDLADGAAVLSFSGGVALPEGSMLGDGTGGSAQLTGSIARDAKGELTLTGKIRGAHLAVLGQLRVFGGDLDCTITTRPLEVKLRVAGASAGLIRRPDGAEGSPSGYWFAVTDLAGSLDLRDGLSLALDAGKVSLPDVYQLPGGGGDGGQGAAPAPSLSIVAGAPLLLSAKDRKLAVSGAIEARDFTAAAPGGDGPRGTLAKGRLHFDASLALGEPLDAGALQAHVWFDKVSGDLHIPLPDGTTFDVGFEDVAWDVHGLPTGKIGLKKELAINFAGDAPDCFRLVLPGPGPDGAMRNQLTVAAQGSNHQFTFDGSLRLEIPVQVLSADGADGDAARVALEGTGTVGFSDAPGGSLQLAITSLAVEGKDLCLGGSGGLKIRQASVRATHLDTLASGRADAQKPFTLELTGDVQFADDGPHAAVRNARFEFTDLALSNLNTFKSLPKFTVGELEIGLGSKFEMLPIDLESAAIEFKQPELPLLPPKGASADGTTFLLDPRNLTIKASVKVKVPLGSGSGGGAFMARTDRIQASIEHGLPKLSLGGIGFGVTGLAVPGMTLDGAVYLGGLDTEEPFFAGKVGGTVDGTGLSVLLAFGFKKQLLPQLKPMGLALDVEAGSVGIPLGPTGFLFTGAAGGLSFLACPIDPSDLASYIDVPTDGAAAKRKKPYPEKPADPDPKKAPSPDAAPSERPQHSAAPEFKCPGECPPPSLGILYQPHPDHALYPRRAILKFSALDEHALELIGIKSWLQPLRAVADPPKLSREVARAIRGKVEELSPVRVLPKNMQGTPQALLDDLESNLRDQLQRMLLEAGAGKTPWEIVKAAAWAGLEAVNETYQLTGTFSYAGVSAFASVTGGVNISEAGSIGVIGYLNVLGLRLGKVKAFFTLNDANGMPDPTLCGDLRIALGPLELGMVGFSYRLGYSAAALLEGLSGALKLLAGPVLEAMVLEVLPLADRARFGLSRDGKGSLELTAVLPQLSQQQLVSLVGRTLSSGAKQLTPQLLEQFVRALVHAVWDAYNPEIVFCGMVAPKIFGLQIGNELIAVRGQSDKLSLKCEFQFSPLSLIGACLPYVGGILYGHDKAVFGFSLKLPDPLDLVDECIDAFLQPGPGDAQAFVERAGPELAGVALRGFSRLLEEAVYVASYELAPLGMKLAGVTMRVLMPSVLHHPRYHPEWKNPDTLPQLPSRSDLLVAATAQGKLAQLSWKGTPADLAQLSFASGKSAAGKSLADDYFPHGGYLGGGYLKLPKILVEGPPLDLIAKITDGGRNPLDRATAALELVQKWLLVQLDAGQLSFYLPAPNPPPGQSPADLAKLVQSLCKLQIPAGKPLTEDLVPLGLAFFRGKVTAKILGLDLGEGELECAPASSDPHAEGLLRAHFKAQTLGPLRELLQLQGEVKLEIRGRPPEPIEVFFGKLAARLTAELAAARLHPHDAAGLEKAGRLAAEVAASLEQALPRFWLQASASFKLPPAIASVVTAQGGFELVASSPGSGPASDTTPVGRIKHAGGAAVRGKLSFGAFGFSLTDQVEASLEPDPTGAHPPRVRAAWTRTGMAVPGAPSGTSFAELHASFDSRPDPGGSVAVVSGQIDLPELKLGPFDAGAVHVEAISVGPSLAARFEARLAAGGGFSCEVSAQAQVQGLVLSVSGKAVTKKPRSPLELAQALREAVQQEFEQQLRPGALGQQIEHAAAAAREAAKKAVEQAMQAASAEAERIKEQAGKFRDQAEKFKDQAGKLATDAGKELGNAAKSATDAGQQLADATHAKENAKKVEEEINQLKKAASDMANDIKNKLESAGGSVGDGIKHLFGG